MNPLLFLSGLSLSTKAFLILSVFLSGFYAGWQIHGWKKDAGQARSTKTQIKTATALANESKPIIEKKVAEEQKTQIVYRTIREKIYEKNDTGICFDAESLKLWNDAIAGADNYRSKPARTPATDDAAERYVANVEQVLSNAADNFETCNRNSIKHNALIEKVESLQGKICVCGE